MIDPEELEALASQVEEEAFLTADLSRESTGDRAHYLAETCAALNDAAEALRRAADKSRKAVGL